MRGTYVCFRCAGAKTGSRLSSYSSQEKMRPGKGMWRPFERRVYEGPDHRG